MLIFSFFFRKSLESSLKNAPQSRFCGSFRWWVFLKSCGSWFDCMQTLRLPHGPFEMTRAVQKVTPYQTENWDVKILVTPVSFEAATILSTPIYFTQLHFFFGPPELKDAAFHQVGEHHRGPLRGSHQVKVDGGSLPAWVNFCCGATSTCRKVQG